MSWTVRILSVTAVLAFLLLYLPSEAQAWTPGTHIYLGDTVLANLRFLPAAVADLLHAFPFDYLYGTVAADTSIAKKYVPPGRHSHSWLVGQEVHDSAATDRLRAFGLGYLSHLAADTVAHNYFIPRQLLLTSHTRSMGHSYWESRIEAYLTSRYARKARQIITLDQSAADRHLETIISPTIFSIKTNRRIFRSLVHLAELKGWQETMRAARERGGWPLTEQEVERHLAVAYDFTMELLGAGPSRARLLDPNGARQLAQAKRIRRKALIQGNWRDRDRWIATAEEHFGLPDSPLEFWSDSIREIPWSPNESRTAAGLIIPNPETESADYSAAIHLSAESNRSTSSELV